jgi:hypothetical protein
MEGINESETNADFHADGKCCPNIYRNFTPRFKSRDLNSQTFPLFSPQRHPLPPTRSHNQRYPMRSASSFMHHGRESPPLDPRDPTNYWKCCPLIDSESTAYYSPLRPPQMAGLPCLRLIDRTSVLTAFPTITYSYRPKRYRFRAHLPQICRLHYRCTRNARR